MAQIFPFKGIKYSPDKVGDLAAVMTQPYDKITPAIQEAYYARHEKNFVRIAKGRVLDGDGETENQYTRAGEYFEQWLADGTLARDEKPCIYVYQTEYTIPTAKPGAVETKLRNGFIALAGLQDFSEGGVKPHEKTFAGPKADRLNLMRATGANFECIFMLYSDPERSASTILEETIAAGAPALEVTTEEGETHRIWNLSHPAKIETIAGCLAGKDLFIADGHHRYETAVNYMNEMREAGRRCEGPQSSDNYMMTFVNMSDELTILPTHRILGDVPGMSSEAVLEKLREAFDVHEFPFADAEQEKLAREAMMNALAARAEETALGFYAHGIDMCFLLTLKEGVDPARRIDGPNSDAWKRLDVVVLHSMIMEQMLGVTSSGHDEGVDVWYERIAGKGMDQVREGKHQVLFVLNPTRIEAVRQIAGSGEKMPQKSTDFYPKLLSGVVMNKLNFVD